MKKLLLFFNLILAQQIYSQCTAPASNFGNNTSIVSYNISGDVSVVLNTNNTVTLNLGANFSTASGPDVNVYLVNSNGASISTMKSSHINSLKHIKFGLTQASGSQSYTVAIPVDKDIKDFDTVFFFCFQFSQFWDLGTFTPFTDQNCSLLNNETIDFENSIYITPNPSPGIIHIANLNSSNGNLEIFNTVGQKVYEQKNNLNQDIDISNLNSGIYLVRMHFNNKIRTEKLILE